MNLKTSFFNKSLIKSDVKRLWWVGALYALMIFVSFTFVFLDYVLDGYNTDIVFLQKRFSNLAETSVIWALVFPVGLSVLIFSYLNSSKAVACLHGLPIKRKSFFASHTLSGAIILTLPVILNGIILLLFCLNPKVNQSFELLELFKWIGILSLYNILIFSFTSMVAMISANNVATIVFTYIFGVLPLMAESFVNYFFYTHLYGYITPEKMPVMTFLYHIPEDLFGNGWFCLKYVIFAIVFLGLAYLFYRKRKLEYNAEIVAFPKLRPIFVYGVALCSGALGYLYLTSFFPSSNILFLIPFGILGIVIAQMIVRKSLKPQKVLKPIIVFSIAVVVLQFAFQIDISGFERRIPDIDDIASVSFDNRINYQEYSYSNRGERINYDNNQDLDFYDTEDIQNCHKLHKELVENRMGSEKYKNLSGRSTNIYIHYKLKNGRTLSRTYFVNYENHKEFLEPIIESEQIRKKYFPILKDIPKEYDSISINDRRLNREFAILYSNQELFDELLFALSEDLKITDYDEFAQRDGELTEIQVVYTKPAKYFDGKAVPKNELPYIHETYYVRADFEKTIDVLEKMGFYDSLPTYQDIKSVGVEYFKSDVEYTVKDFQGNDVYHKLIENPEEIKEVFEYCVNNYTVNYYSGETMGVCQFNLDGYTFRIEFGGNNESLPKVLIP